MSVEVFFDFVDDCSFECVEMVEFCFVGLDGVVFGDLFEVMFVFCDDDVEVL